MSDEQTKTDVLQQLEHALSANNLPDEEKRRAAQLLSRLKSPVQVVLIGEKGVGKTRLINMLIGTSLSGGNNESIPLEITYGSQERTVYLQDDGTETALDGLQLDIPAPADTALMRVELPVALLRHMSLTEVSLTGDQQNRRAFSEWAMERANIVLWCSQTFDRNEQMLWSSASEPLKDHSYLVLCKADQLQMQGILTDRIAQLADIVAEEFFRMYPVATIQAISSLGADGSRDEDIWTSSGGRALAGAVQQLVDTGRRADSDNALMFLNRYAPVLADFERGTPVPKVEDHNRDDKPAPEKAVHHVRPKVFQNALDFLQERADLMLEVVADNQPGKQSVILDHCLETADGLSEIMLEVDQTDPQLSVIQEDIMECSDMMVLFHLEKTENAAADAVTLLLQLKKEMSVAAAI